MNLSEYNDNNPYEKISLFAQLSDGHIQTLEAMSIVQDYVKNTVIITQGEESRNLYLVLSGQLKVFVNGNDGDEFIHEFLNPGEYFGELALFSPGPRNASVMTTAATRLAILPGSRFIQYIEENPKIAIAILSSFAQRIRAISERSAGLGLLDVYGRLSEILQKKSIIDKSGRRITQKLTQQEIANYIGSSREMVSRILKELRTGGYIEILGKQIVLLKALPQKW